MDYILLSTFKYKLIVYAVPKEVSNNLEAYCNEFIEYMANPNKTQKSFIISNIKTYDDTCFILWLNNVKFINKQSFYVEEFDYTNDFKLLPKQYKKIKHFNFHD